MSRRTRGLGAQHEQRRLQIADAVLAIIAEQGLSAVSLSTVAARAGVSGGRVQHYFPAKKELIEVAFDRANALSSARIRELVGQDLQRATAREVLTVVLTELIPYDPVRRVHLRVRQSFAALALADEHIAERLRIAYAWLHHQIADLMRKDQTAGWIPVDADTDADAVALVALAEGLAYYVLIDVYSADAARNRLLTAIGDVYAMGPSSRRSGRSR